MKGSRYAADYYDYYDHRLQRGDAFWMGGAFIIAGIFSVVGERRKGGWVHLATFFNLAGVVTGFVGLVPSVLSVLNTTYRSGFIDFLCQKREREVQARGGLDSLLYYEDSRKVTCQQLILDFLNMGTEVRILMLVFAAIAVGISLFSLGYGLWVLWNCFRARAGGYDTLAQKDVPPPYDNKEKDPEKEVEGV